MSKYLITMKSLNGTDKEFDEKYADGVICDGFVICAKNRDDTPDAVAIHKLTLSDIACAMAVSDDLTRAAYLCKAMRESERVTRGSSFGDLLRMMAEDEDDD